MAHRPEAALPERRYRRDVEGLRAVAILAVVAYHAGLPEVSGGYIGVDVFFVVSGFVITRLLLTELAEKGRISFAAFYARRARRLLPAATLVVAVTMAACVALVPPLEVPRAAGDGLASALYFANYRFALQQTSYLSAGGPVSPFLHFWSLGVEEQFYLLWPAVLLVCSLAWSKRRARPSHLAAGCGLAALAAGSFALSLLLTRADQPLAFFSLPTRAWELAAGGLVAIAEPRLGRLSPALLTAVGWCGMAAIVWSAVSLSATTPFPGLAALAPVGGAAAMIAAGTGAARPAPATLLSAAPFRAIGRVSYTWYLWHWPALVLAPAVLGHRLSLASNVEVALVSLLLAWLTTLLVEQPARRSTFLTARPRRSLALGATASATAALTTVASLSVLPPLTGQGRAPRTKLVSRALHTAPSTAASAPRSAASGPSPAVLSARSLTAEVNRAVARSLEMTSVPANLNPALPYVVGGDMATPFYDGCFDEFSDVTVHPCSYADLASKTRVVLFGDSHATMWFPALYNLAELHHWNLVSLGKATCPPLDVPVFSPDLGEWYMQCYQWRAAVLRRIREMRPALVVLGFSREYGVGNDHVLVDGPAWLRGLKEMIETLRSYGTEVVVMGDDPYPPGLVPDCLSAHMTDLAACTIAKRPPAFNAAGLRREEKVVRAAGGHYVNTEPWFCHGDRCAVVVGNIVVYHDDNHVAAAYASWLTPVIGADLRVVDPFLFAPKQIGRPEVHSLAGTGRIVSQRAP